MKRYLIEKLSPLLRLPVVGMDISDRSVKYIKFRRGRTIAFEDTGEFEIPEGIISEGEIKDEAKLTAILKDEGQRKKNLTASLLVASLPEEKSFVRLIQLPKVKRDDIANAIRWEIEANIPLPADNLTYDYEIVEKTNQDLTHIDIVVTAFPKSLIDSYTRVITGAGLKLAVLELESQAIIRAVIESNASGGAKIVVDIGKNRTSFIAFAGNAIIFTSTIQTGGNTFEEAIASALSIDKNHAVEIKEKIGLTRGETDRKVFDALHPTLETLSNEIKRVVTYYQEHTEHLHGIHLQIDEILLVGGDANLFGLDTFIGSALKLPVKQGNPLVNILPRYGSAIPPLPKNKLLSFATTIGLALRDIS